ncbi:hypothetical protein BKA93DRAFT_740959 [Sparassis latifolia]
MIGDSLPEYIFIQLSIFFLRLVAPLSILYTLASWYSGQLLFPPWLGYYSLTEAAFYLFVYLPRNVYLQKVGFRANDRSVCCYAHPVKSHLCISR